MKDDQPAGNGPYLHRMGWAICMGFCWLAERLSYATAAMLLTDLIAWEHDGYVVRKYLNIDAPPGADEQARYQNTRATAGVMRRLAVSAVVHPAD